MASPTIDVFFLNKPYLTAKVSQSKENEANESNLAPLIHWAKKAIAPGRPRFGASKIHFTA